MKKQDLVIIVILFILMLAWPMFYSRLFPPPAPALGPAVVTVTNAVVEQAVVPGTGAAPATVSATLPAPPPAPVMAAPAKAESRLARLEEKVALTNNDCVVTFSSWGGGIVAAELKSYPASIEKNSGPVILDFSNLPALTYSALPGLSVHNDFTLACDQQASTLVMENASADGLHLVRSVRFCGEYQLEVTDVFTNAGTQALTLPEHALQVGPMRMVGGESKTVGLDVLGADALPSSGGEGVKFWASSLAKLFKQELKERQLPALPQFVNKKEEVPVDWIAAKSKFFVQILAPEGGAAGYRLQVGRVIPPEELKDPAAAPGSAEIENVSATALFAGKTLNPGDTLTRTIKYYVGPKKFSILKLLGLHQEDVMDFGWWSPICKFLLLVMNATYTYIPNYGIAIILLTFLIRVIFWPLTHKSTESMKKMQELQPQMQEIRKKYKDSPRKMQEETMGLYRKHKVNPVSGCLPMIVQIPVFFALFVVLRSAIELRFAGFLWIRDLSAPERLFVDLLPPPFNAWGLNILPIFMAATMAWQQKLTPSASVDPAQQKMMLIFMPLMMLVMFYSMPSALVLYWSVNQCVMIVQLLIQKRRSAAKAALAT